MDVPDVVNRITVKIDHNLSDVYQQIDGVSWEKVCYQESFFECVKFIMVNFYLYFVLQLWEAVVPGIIPKLNHAGLDVVYLFMCALSSKDLLSNFGQQRAIGI